MKIQLKRSSKLDGGVAKQPEPDQLEYGELAVNYASADPAIFIKDSTNNIVQIAGANSLTAVPTLNDVTTEGNWSSSALLVGSSLADPNLSLGATGAITAKDTVTVQADTATFSSIVVSDANDNAQFKVIGNGGVALGGTIDTTTAQSQANIFLNADTGNIRAITGNTSGTFTSGGKLTVSANGADITGTVDINNSLNVTEGTALTGAVTMGNTLEVTGVATLKSNASVDGTLGVTGVLTADTYNLDALDALPE